MGRPWCWITARPRCGAAASAGPASPRWPRAARASSAPSAEESARIRAKHGFLKSITIAADSYPGIDAPLNSVGSFSFILARPTLADDVAYRLARALHRGEAALVQKLDQARETTAANTAAAAARQDLIHPGVLRYLREIEVATTQ